MAVDGGSSDAAACGNQDHCHQNGHTLLPETGEGALGFVFFGLTGRFVLGLLVLGRILRLLVGMVLLLSLLVIDTVNDVRNLLG